MLSSCWLTSPFTGCFNPEVKGGIGSIEDSSTKQRLAQNLFVNKEKSIANGSAGGSTLLGGSAVTTTAPRSSYANQVITGQGLTKNSESSNHKEFQQPQTPRKSKSMGRIHGSDDGDGGDAKYKAGEGIANPLANKDEGVHPEFSFRGHRRVPSDGVAWCHSKALEGERGGMDEDERELKRTYKSEYRKKFRPFSQYQYIDGKFQKTRNDEVDGSKAWYKEVLELRRQAGQYRAKHDSGKVWETVQCRGWGVETASERMNEIYSKQLELWDQVSKRSSLQALSLATSAAPRPISKAEKELENSRRSSPLKHSTRDRHITIASKPPKAAPLHKSDKGDSKTSKEITPRHHYDKTSGSAGHIITSPTRVKLDPACPNGVTGSRTPRKSPSAKSPIKDFSMKKSSPRTISVARTSPTKEKKTSLGRSVSVGPENRSPKRTSRPPSTHVPPPPPTKNERRPRPTSLSANSRRKDNAVGQQEKKAIKKPFDVHGSPKRSDFKAKEDRKRPSTKDAPLRDATDAIKDSFTARKATPEPRFYPEKYEPVVKTPPEPTRVKSPDQVLVKSPDSVNWTVPLDTGKTFTVTHNIPEGEASRSTSSSEYRSRQTPEPTKVYQGSIAGTPITTAGTVMPSEHIAVTSSAPGASSVNKVEDVSKVTGNKHEQEQIIKAEAVLDASVSKAATNEKLGSSINKSVTDIKDQPTSSVKINEKVAIGGKNDTSETLASTEKNPSKENIKHDTVSDIKLEEIKGSQTIGTLVEPNEEPFIGQSSYNNVPSSGFSTETQDPMTMSIFGSLNGVREIIEPMNKTKEVHTKTATVANPNPIASVLPASNIRRLDDPFLEQSSHISMVPTNKIPSQVAPIDPMTSSTYKVLEAPPSIKESKDNKSASQDKPSMSAPYRVLEAPTSVPPVPKPAPYRVLEAPLADFSNQKSEPVKEIKHPTEVSPPSGKTIADSLDKAHNRFDSHWTASDKNTTGNV